MKTLLLLILGTVAVYGENENFEYRIKLKEIGVTCDLCIFYECIFEFDCGQLLDRMNLIFRQRLNLTALFSVCLINVKKENLIVRQDEMEKLKCLGEEMERLKTTAVENYSDGRASQNFQYFGCAPTGLGNFEQNAVGKYRKILEAKFPDSTIHLEFSHGYFNLTAFGLLRRCDDNHRNNQVAYYSTVFYDMKGSKDDDRVVAIDP